MQGAGSDRTGIIRGQDAGKPPLPDAFAKAPASKYARILNVVVSMMPACLSALHAPDDGCAPAQVLPPAAGSNGAPSAALLTNGHAEQMPSLFADVDAVDRCDTITITWSGCSVAGHNVAS